MIYTTKKLDLFKYCPYQSFIDELVLENISFILKTHAQG